MDTDHEVSDGDIVQPQSSNAHQSVLTVSPAGKLAAKRASAPNPSDKGQLRFVAKETISVLPGLLLTRPDAKPHGILYEKDGVAALDPKFRPKLSPTKVRVINCDTIDAALGLHRKSSDKPVYVLNMANATCAGGGFQNGAVAQEEALCYRSSLSFTLKLRHYPIPEKGAIYSPRVLVIRDSLSSGHKLLDCRDPSQLPVISVISAAAQIQPALVSTGNGAFGYRHSSDRNLVAAKMRIILRTAIRNKHRKIVLGAFGCGVFQNPVMGVCKLWKDILQEPEFSGGWWEDVVFAVLSSGRNGNFNTFHRMLDGIMV